MSNALNTCMTTIAKLGAPIAPFFMDRLYQDLNKVTQKESSESVHLAEFPKFNVAFVDKSLERKMESAQTISSLVLSLRAKEKIKVRQPLQKIMIPVDGQQQKEEILTVSNLIKHEVNIKEIQLMEDASLRISAMPVQDSSMQPLLPMLLCRRGCMKMYWSLQLNFKVHF